MRFYFLYYCLTVLLSYGFLSSCITPFEPVGVKDNAGVLVVEGMISDVKTTIMLRRTVRLDERLSGASSADFAVDHAVIHLIDEANATIAVAEQQIIDEKTVPGTYSIKDTILFTPGMKYALDIKIGNKHYRSDFVSPVHTPEIDEVSWKFNDDLSVDIMVSTHDPANEIKYFRWAFEEDWEIRAPFLATHRYDPTTREIIVNALHNSNNNYYCWGSDISKSMITGSSDKLTEATVKNKPIYRIQARDNRLAFLYSILVKQYGLDKDAYIYFENLRKNAEEVGSLFGTQPASMTGNIRSLSDPDERVIGYVTIAKEKTRRIFISENSFFRLPYCSECLDCYGFINTATAPVSEMHSVYLLGSYIYEYRHNTPTFTAIAGRCVDCTLNGGTKNRPDFWPNNHQ